MEHNESICNLKTLSLIINSAIFNHVESDPKTSIHRRLFSVSDDTELKNVTTIG